MSRATQYCCLVSAILGVLLVAAGIGVLLAGESMIESAILKSMALEPGGDRLKSWLNPPVQPALTAYAFHVTNPEAVQKGRKPIVEEIGPFVYKAVNIKDSFNEETGKENLEFNDDGETLTYRLR